jgi:type IX secretion system PorP/SprF family membrane protein
MNNYALNPAAGGASEFTDIKVGYRNQWTGFEGAPKTFFVSANTPIGYPKKGIRRASVKPHHGIGGYAYRDRTGPLTTSGIYGSYAYHLKMSRKLTASLGAFVGLMQYQMNASEFNFVQNPNDPLISKSDYSRILPDATIGLWLYSDRVFFGLSIHQLLQNQLKFEGAQQQINSIGKLNNHYFITGGYRFSLNDDLDFIPSTMIKYVQGAPLQVDLNARLRYKQMVWLGTSYRHQDAMTLFAGALINNMFEIGYGYDITTSVIRKGSSGSHEIILGLLLGRNGKVYCPSDFWD